MIIKNIILILVIGGFIIGCEDDDVCTEGVGTPNMVVVFKSYATLKKEVQDSIYLERVDSESTSSVFKYAQTDSLSIPLRFDVSTQTVYKYYKRKGETPDIITITYTQKDEYASKACGFKRVYTGVSMKLSEPTNVIDSISSPVNQIVNQDETHLYIYL